MLGDESFEDVESFVYMPTKNPEYPPAGSDLK
jgi:hypothetical protein